MKRSYVLLTDAIVLDLKARERKYCVWDMACPGFGVEVTPTKIKHMVVKTCTTIQGKQHRDWHPLGDYGLISTSWTDPATGQPRSRKWTVDDFRRKALEVKGQVKSGEDPKAVVSAKKAEVLAQREAKAREELARQQRVTVNQLADRFIRDHIKAEVTLVGSRKVITKIGSAEGGNRLSTAKEHIRYIDRFIRPVLGEMAVEDVTPRHLDALLSAIREETPIQANRVYAVLSKMFNRADRWLDRPHGSNPVRKQDDREPELKRERNLSDAEIQMLGHGLRTEAEKPPKPTKGGSTLLAERTIRLRQTAHAAIKFSLLTGMRKGEIQCLRWEWVDLDAGLARLPAPDHKTGKKTRRARVVLLSQAALDLLHDLPRILGNPFVFAGKGHGPLVDLQSPWESVRLAAGLDAWAIWKAANEKTWAQASEVERRDLERALYEAQVHFHDLRRTFASVSARLGHPELWIATLMGHAAGTVTQGYARTSVRDDPLRKAAEEIGERITTLMDSLSICSSRVTNLN